MAFPNHSPNSPLSNMALTIFDGVLILLIVFVVQLWELGAFTMNTDSDEVKAKKRETRDNYEKEKKKLYDKTGRARERAKWKLKMKVVDALRDLRDNA